MFIQVNFCLSDSLATYLFLLILLLGRGHKGIFCSVPDRSLPGRSIPPCWLSVDGKGHRCRKYRRHFLSLHILQIVPQRSCYPVLHPTPSPVFLIFSQPTSDSTVLTCWLTNHRTSQNLGKQILNSEFPSYIFLCFHAP